MNIEIKSPSEVIVDGTNFGAVADAIANNKPLAADIQRALVAYDAAKSAAAEKARKDEVDKITAQLNDTKAAAQKAQQEAKAAADKSQQDAVDKLQKQLDEAKKANDALQAEFNAYKTVAGQAATAIENVIGDESVDDTKTVQAIRQIVHVGKSEANKTEDERTVAALTAQKAEIEKKLAALQSPSAAE